MEVKNLFVFVMIFLWTSCGFSEVVTPPLPANRLSVLVDVLVEYDRKNDIYKYSYSLSNSSSSQQEISFFALSVNEDKGSVIEATSPEGWRFSSHLNEDYISWQAVEGVPSDYIDDGGVPPSLFQIKPGESLTGYSIVSKNMPIDTNYYVQGYTPLPSVTEDVDEFDDEGYEIKHFSQNSVSALVKGPAGKPIFSGNRRPSVDGFVGLVDFDPDNNQFSRPKKIVVKFALGGEKVDASTFKAILNKQDVTSLFIIDDSGSGDLAIELDNQDGIAIAGENVLILSVQGVSPNNGNAATDTDRIVFELF